MRRSRTAPDKKSENQQDADPELTTTGRSDHGPFLLSLHVIDKHHVCGPSGRSAGSEDENFAPEMKNLVLSVCFSVAVSPRGHSGVSRVKYTKRLLVGVVWVLISIGNFLARPEPAKNP